MAIVERGHCPKRVDQGKSPSTRVGHFQSLGSSARIANNRLRSVQIPSTLQLAER